MEPAHVPPRAVRTVPMFTAAELLALLESHEADRVELTTSRSNTQKWSEAVCAFANDLPDHRLPGYLIVE